jgi:hypothetical protein
MSPVPHLIRALNTRNGLPENTIRRCLSQPQDSVPALLDLLNKAAREEYLDDDEGDALFLAVHILGELRETQAYRPLIQLLRCDDDVLDIYFGDALTETISGILISVCDGDPAPLYQMINDPQCNTWARNAAFTAWIGAVLNGTVEDPDVQRRLLQWEKDLEPRDDSVIWSPWIEAAAVLGLKDAAPLVRQIIDDGRLPERFMTYQDFEIMLADIAQDREAYIQHNVLGPFTDTIGKLARWDAFSAAHRREQYEQEHALMPIESETAHNPFKGVGRNDLCPCGSGKKFKKCCLPTLT